MVAGNPGAGKTCLANRLLNKPNRKSQCTNGVEISTCIILPNPDEASKSIWHIPEAPLYERIYQNFSVRFSDLIHAENLESSPVHKISRHNEWSKETHYSELKIWDINGDYGPYTINKMFLSPCNVCLFVLNIGKGLKSPLEFSSTKSPHSPRTVLESLDYWLRAIDRCVGQDKDDDYNECTVIVLTHTDLINVKEKENKIKEYKKEILKHVKSQHTCKYVYHEIFTLNDTDIDENELSSLKKAIVERGESKHTFGDEKPCTWLQLEANMLRFSSEKGRGYISLKELYLHANKSLGMSLQDLRAFLRFHHRYRNLIFDDGTLDLLENIYCNFVGITTTPLVITDPKFLDDAFRAIITLWECRNPRNPSLQTQQEINMDFERDLVSVKTLRSLWNDLDDSTVDGLVDIFVRFDLLIPCESSESSSSSRKYIVPTLVASFVGSEQLSKIFQELESLQPLIYWFHQSSDPYQRELSGIHTENFFFQLIASLRDLMPEQGTWELRKLYSDAATFRAGPQGQVLVTIASHACALVLKLCCIQNAMSDQSGHVISRIRYWFEEGIREIIEKVCPSLKCSVCVSPCMDKCSIAANHVKYDCLESLGTLGKVTKQLPYAICEMHHKFLHPEEYKSWFCIEPSEEKELRNSKREKQEQKDTKTLNGIAQKVGDVSTLRSLALELGVTSEDVETRMTDYPRKIDTAAFNVLYKDWYRKVPGTLQKGSNKHVQLTKAMEEAGLVIYA